MTLWPLCSLWLMPFGAALRHSVTSVVRKRFFAKPFKKHLDTFSIILYTAPEFIPPNIFRPGRCCKTKKGQGPHLRKAWSFSFCPQKDATTQRSKSSMGANDGHRQPMIRLAGFPMGEIAEVIEMHQGRMKQKKSLPMSGWQKNATSGSRPPPGTPLTSLLARINRENA